MKGNQGIYAWDHSFRCNNACIGYNNASIGYISWDILQGIYEGDICIGYMHASMGYIPG
jgi:hypothetical protein